MSRSSDALDAPGKPKFRECLPAEGPFHNLPGSNPRTPCDIEDAGNEAAPASAIEPRPDFFADVQE